MKYDKTKHRQSSDFKEIWNIQTDMNVTQEEWDKIEKQDEIENLDEKVSQEKESIQKIYNYAKQESFDIINEIKQKN